MRLPGMPLGMGQCGSKLLSNLAPARSVATAWRPRQGSSARARAASGTGGCGCRREDACGVAECAEAKSVGLYQGEQLASGARGLRHGHASGAVQAGWHEHSCLYLHPGFPSVARSCRAGDLAGRVRRRHLERPAGERQRRLDRWAAVASRRSLRHTVRSGCAGCAARPAVRWPDGAGVADSRRNR